MICVLQMPSQMPSTPSMPATAAASLQWYALGTRLARGSLTLALSSSMLPLNESEITVLGLWSKHANYFPPSTVPT